MGNAGVAGRRDGASFGELEEQQLRRKLRQSTRTSLSPALSQQSSHQVRDSFVEHALCICVSFADRRLPFCLCLLLLSVPPPFSAHPFPAALSYSAFRPTTPSLLSPSPPAMILLGKDLIDKNMIAVRDHRQNVPSKQVQAAARPKPVLTTSVFFTLSSTSVS